MDLVLNTTLCEEITEKYDRVFLSEGVDTDFEAHSEYLSEFLSYETAYYQLVYEIAKKVITAIDLISDKSASLSKVYISGVLIGMKFS